MEMALTEKELVPADYHASLDYCESDSRRSTLTMLPMDAPPNELCRSNSSSGGSGDTRSLVRPTNSYANYQIQSHQVILRSIGDTHEVLTNAPYNDGHMWRKYGEKKITGFAFRRYYYRCTYKEDQGCPAIKQVHQQQKYLNETPMYLVVYKKKHTCNTASTLISSAANYSITEGSPEDHEIKIEPIRPFSIHFSIAVDEYHEHHEANLWPVSSAAAAVDIQSSKKLVEADHQHSKDHQVLIGEVISTDNPLLSNNSECSIATSSTATSSTATSISTSSSSEITMKSENSIMEKMNDHHHHHQISSMALNPNSELMTNFWSTSTYEDPLTWYDTSYLLMEDPLWWW